MQKTKNQVGIIAWFLLLSIMIFGCATVSDKSKPEIDENVLESFSKDLADLNLMVKMAGEETKNIPKNVEIIKPWTSMTGMKFGKISPGQKEIYEALAGATIKVPTSTGPTLAEIVKLKKDDKSIVGVFDPKDIKSQGEMGDWQAWVAAGPAPEYAAGGYPIRFFNPKLASNASLIEAVKDVVEFLVKTERWTKTITAQIIEFKEKYADFGIKVEGFSVAGPIFNVEIQFKFN
jgi:hypothetical protein